MTKKRLVNKLRAPFKKGLKKTTKPRRFNNLSFKTMSKNNSSQTKVAKTAAAGIDPKNHTVNVVMTDGSKFQIITTWGKEGDTLRLDVDPKNHPAWQEKSQKFINANDERVAKFKNKFGNFDFATKKASS